jgi:ribosome silencing factor RsfS/YbeB/iojap
VKSTGAARKAPAKPKAAPPAKAKAPARPKPAATRSAPAPKPRAAPKAAAKPAPKRSAAATTPKAAPKPAAKAAPKRSAAAAKPKSAAGAAPKAAPKPAAPAKAPTPRAAAKPPAKAPAAPRPARAARAPRQKVEPALLDRLVAAATRSLEDDKAENLVVLDVTGRADYADRLVIATGLADRQIQAMATHLEDAFEKEGLKLRRDAIQGSPDWVLIDCGDLVVHLFKPEARALYALERMWGPDSPAAPGAQDDRTPLPDDGGGSTATEEDDE